jgi:hemerythrin-like domain-containing protein
MHSRVAKEARMHRPTDILRAEHQLILRALDVLAAAATLSERGAEMPDAWWSDAVAWIREFADRNHHGKEEDRLFPALVKAGVPKDGGPVGVMLAEHVEGRKLVGAIEAASGASRARAARGFVNLLRAHIDKEDNVLFNIADGVLDEAVQARLGREFAAVADELGPTVSIDGARARLDTLAAALDAAAVATAR